MKKNSKIAIIILAIVVVILAAVVAFLLLREGDSEITVEKPIAQEDEKGEESQEDVPPEEEEVPDVLLEGVLFRFPEGKGEYVLMDGDRLAAGEEESKEIILGTSADFNGELKGKIFLSGTGVNGINAMLYYGDDIRQNLINITRPLADVAFDGNNLKSNQYMQITAIDIDEDGMKEILFSVGLPLTQVETAVFSIGKSNVKWLGTISSLDHVEKTGPGELLSRNGNDAEDVIFTFKDGVLSGKNLIEAEAAVTSEMLAGEWERLVPEDSHIFRLSFNTDWTAGFAAGWIESSWAYYYEGTFFLEGNIATFEMLDQFGPSDMDPEYEPMPPFYSMQKLSVNGDVLTIEYVSGDAMFDGQAVGTTHEFKKTN